MAYPTIYCTIYCNKGHLVADGKPVKHECIVIPPEALRLEIDGDIPGAIAVMDKHKPLRVMRRWCAGTGGLTWTRTRTWKN